MYKRITIIGLGSLGGFFAEVISRLVGLETLILIDPDIVEEKNLENSIYRPRDVGKRKVDALKEIILFNVDHVQIQQYFHEFQEGHTRLPETDLVVDCRDSICNRGSKIDVRLSISSKSLIIDCKKNVAVSRERQGRYIWSVTKNEIRSAAFSAFRVIDCGLITDLIRRQVVHYIDLDKDEDGINRSLVLTNNKLEMIYDSCSGEEKLVNLQERIPSILEANRTRDLQVVLGEGRNFPKILEIIQKSSLQTMSDVIRVFSSLARDINFPFEKYYIEVKIVGNSSFVEFYPETGGA
jgi:hypothetical protein